MNFSESCDSSCQIAKELATEAVNRVVSQYYSMTAKKIQEHEESISGLEDNLNRAEDFFQDVYELPDQWREDMISPEKQKAAFVTKVDKLVAAGTITEDQGKQLNAGIDNAFEFNPTVLATKQEMVDIINYQIGVEIANKRKTKDQLNTTNQKVLFYVLSFELLHL